jgi:alpha-L-fucosidase
MADHFLRPTRLQYNLKRSGAMETMNAQPDAVKKAWMELGYGLFLHFGPNTFAGKAWGDGLYPAADFRPTQSEPGPVG